MVVWEENEAFRGSIRRITPTAASNIPKNLTDRALSVPTAELTITVNIGIVTASREVFDADVSDKPVINKS